MKHFLLLSGLALALSATPLAAQSPQDDGQAFVRGAVSVGGPATRGSGCGSGSTTTFFAQNNGFAGNMFDVFSVADFTLECLDVNNTSTIGNQVDIEVWVVSGTCVGKDLGDLCAQGWTMIANGTGTAMGSNVPTPINLAHVGTPFVFQSGNSYGVFVNFTNYSVSRAGYTNAAAPVTYVGTHCDLTTYFGKAAFVPPCTAGSTFTYREFNGTLYTELAGPPSFALAASGSCPGAMTLSTSNGTPGGPCAYVYGTGATAKNVPAGPCGVLTLNVGNSPTVYGIFGNDAGGATSVGPFNAKAAWCGLIRVQCVDIGGCAVSNVVTL